jgi:hypothetical protein
MWPSRDDNAARVALSQRLRCTAAHTAPLIKKGRNSKYIVQKNTPKKYQTKEFFPYVLLF